MADRAVGRRVHGLPVVAELAPDPVQIQEEAQPAELPDADDQPVRVAGRVRKAVAAVEFVLAEFGRGQVHVPQIGEDAPAREVGETVPVNRDAALEALMEGRSAIRDGRGRAARLGRRDDLVREVHSEEREFAPDGALSAEPHAGFVVPRQFRIQIEVLAVAGDGDLGARGREAAMHAREERHVLERPRRKAESRNCRRDAIVLAQIHVRGLARDALAGDVPFLVVMHEPDARRQGQARAELEAILQIARQRVSVPELVVADDAGLGVEAISVDTPVMGFLADIPDAQIELAVAVLPAVVRLGSVHVERPVPVAGRVAEVHGTPRNARIAGDVQIRAPAIGPVEILPPPESLGGVQEGGAAYDGGRAECKAVRQRDRAPLDIQRVGWHRVLARITLEHRSRQAQIGGVRDFVVDAQLQPERVAVAGPERELGLKILDVVVETAPAIALLVQVIDEPADRLVVVAASQGTVADEHAALAAFEVEVAVEPGGRLRRDEVDDASDGLRAVQDLAAALEDLDPVHAFDGRRIVHVGLAVGRQRDREAILEHQHLAAPVRVQAAHANVQPHRRGAGIFAQIDAGHAAQDFVGVDRLRCDEFLLANQMQGAGNRRPQVFDGGHDLDGGAIALQRGHLHG